ncbi:MAG: Uma2 family endonuclease [Saprospirales bacterium]|jgi:Uma2 family endonuclease|nr:Uma2 family endonuclease [Saprospirales bacterium]
MTSTLASFSDLRLLFRNGGPVTLSDPGMTDDEFYAFCLENPELRIERNPNGNILIMPPTGSETGNRNAEIVAEFVFWNRKYQLGKVFDSSTGFNLSNGANRSPDVAWISNERWDALPEAARRKFAPITPDFVVELRSDDQSLPDLREKMEEYLSCGCRLGWLIDPQNRRTYVYAENGDIQTVPFDEPLSGGGVLLGLEVRLGAVLK